MSRMHTYYLLSERISRLTNKEIKHLLHRDEHNSDAKKWGIVKTETIDNHKVFVKAVCLANEFAKNQFDSSNLYNVPNYYNYGYGSAGVNPWRELLMHIKTTYYVLSKKCESFPLLYHYRIIEDDDNSSIESGLDEKLMTRFDNNPDIIKYLTDRINSKHKIVLFLEYVPYVAWEYIQNKNPKFIENFFYQSHNIITFLNSERILHNDAHLGNYLVDENENVYLTDFGLTICSDFKLDEGEEMFMKMNKNLDLLYIGDNVMTNYVNSCMDNAEVSKKYSIDKIQSTIELYSHLLDIIDTVKVDIPITDFEIKFLKRNRSQILEYITWKKNFKSTKNKNNYYSNSVHVVDMLSN